MRALRFGGRARGEKSRKGFLAASQRQIGKFEGGGGDCGDFFPAGDSFGRFVYGSREGCVRVVAVELVSKNIESERREFLVTGARDQLFDSVNQVRIVRVLWCEVFDFSHFASGGDLTSWSKIAMKGIVAVQ